MDLVARRWWEGVALLLAANSVVFGVLGVRSSHWPYAILAGFLPSIALIATTLVPNSSRRVKFGLALAGSLLASISYWMIYPVVLAVVVCMGAFVAGGFGDGGSQDDLTAWAGPR